MRTTLLNEAGVANVASSRKFFPIPDGGLISLQLATGSAKDTAGGTLAATSLWKVYGSNKHGADCDPNGDPLAADITAAFTVPGSSNPIAAVTSGGSSQGVQANGPVLFKYIAVVGTPTSGAGWLYAAMSDARVS